MFKIKGHQTDGVLRIWDGPRTGATASFTKDSLSSYLMAKPYQGHVINDSTPLWPFRNPIRVITQNSNVSKVLKNIKLELEDIDD